MRPGNLRVSTSENLRLKALQPSWFTEKKDPLTTELDSCISLLFVFDSCGWAAGLGFCWLVRNQILLQAIATPAQFAEEHQVARRESKT